MKNVLLEVDRVSTKSQQVSNLSTSRPATQPNYTTGLNGQESSFTGQLSRTLPLTVPSEVTAKSAQPAACILMYGEQQQTNKQTLKLGIHSRGSGSPWSP